MNDSLSAWSLQSNNHLLAKRAYNTLKTQLWSTDEFFIRFRHNRCKNPNFGQLVIGESENSLLLTEIMKYFPHALQTMKLMDRDTARPGPAGWDTEPTDADGRLRSHSNAGHGHTCSGSWNPL